MVGRGPMLLDDEHSCWNAASLELLMALNAGWLGKRLDAVEPCQPSGEVLNRCGRPLQVGAQHPCLLQANPSADTQPTGTFRHQLSQRSIGTRPGDMNAFGTRLRHSIKSAALATRNQAENPGRRCPELRGLAANSVLEMR